MSANDGMRDSRYTRALWDCMTLAQNTVYATQNEDDAAYKHWLRHGDVDDVIDAVNAALIR